MKKIIYLLMICSFYISCNNSKNVENGKPESQIIIDIKNIAGKNKLEVEKVLGKPEKIEPFSESNTSCKNSPCEKGYYKNDQFEIIYINEKADWITINNLSEYDFDENQIEMFGLPKSSPDFSNPQSNIRWKNIENIKEINIFNNGSNKIDYAYIKVLTE